MLVTSKQMILDAQKGGYAIGCFNTSDLEITKAIIRAAEIQRAPVTVATSEKAIKFGGVKTLAALIKEEAKNASVPVALHLDHGKSIHTIEECLGEGYTSVMFDGSEFFLDKNIELTAEAVSLAHAKSVPCEGELGHLGKVGESESQLTDPYDVPDFVRKTQIDFLALSIGSSHGAGAEERLDIGLLKRIRLKTDIPLVLHGGSGVPDGDIKAAIKNGISKVNIDTDIRHEFTKDLRQVLGENPEEQDPREILGEVIEKIQKLIENKIKLFGSNNKV